MEYVQALEGQKWVSSGSLLESGVMESCRKDSSGGADGTWSISDAAN